MLLAVKESFLIRFCTFYAYTRPRYQVSIYRTIGPLVIELQTVYFNGPENKDAPKIAVIMLI